MGHGESPELTPDSVLKIVVCDPEVGVEEQEKRSREATIYLPKGFVKINWTVLSSDQSLPEQFTMKSIIAYLAHKNSIPLKVLRG